MKIETIYKKINDKTVLHIAFEGFEELLELNFKTKKEYNKVFKYLYNIDLTEDMGDIVKCYEGYFPTITCPCTTIIND